MNRIVRAIQFDPTVYSEIAADKGGLFQALLIAVLSSVATGIGSAKGDPQQIPYLIMTAFIGWLIWMVTTLVIGTLIPGPDSQPNLGTIIRVGGIASAPGLLRLIAYLPPFSVIAPAGAMIWMFATTAIAFQQAFQFKNLSRALGVTLIGWILYQWFYFKM